MNNVLNLNLPLQSVCSFYANTRVKEALIIVASVTLLAISAHLIIPLQPVPLTFQSAAVIFVGMIYGFKLGTKTLIAYLIAGFCGLPVFAPHASSLLFGPTAGYLIGFLCAGAICGYLAQNGFAKTILGSFVATCIGAGIIFLFGISVLSLFIGWKNAITTGLLPFILTEPLKLLAISMIIPKFWNSKTLKNE